MLLVSDARLLQLMIKFLYRALDAPLGPTTARLILSDPGPPGAWQGLLTQPNLQHQYLSNDVDGL